MTPTWGLLEGDVLDRLREIAAERTERDGATWER